MIDQPPDANEANEDDLEAIHQGMPKTPTESDYLRRLSLEKKAVVIQMQNGNSFRGFVEYYDKRFIRLTREKAPNVFVFKQNIKYISEE